MQGKDIIPTDPNAHAEVKDLPRAHGKCVAMNHLMMSCDADGSAAL